MSLALKETSVEEVRDNFAVKIPFINEFLSFFFSPFTDSNDLKSMHKNSLSPVHTHFITKNSTRVISQRGGLAILPCSVTMSQPATVSETWNFVFRVCFFDEESYFKQIPFLLSCDANERESCMERIAATIKWHSQ